MALAQGRYNEGAVVPRMADEADPENVLAVKTSAPGGLSPCDLVGLSDNLEVLGFE